MMHQMSSLTIQLSTQEEQTVLNLERWSDVIESRELARWPGRVETDCQGQILISPPSSCGDGGCRGEICYFLRQILSGRKLHAELPNSTPDGVAANAAWLSRTKLARVGRKVCFGQAPEICGDTLSAANTRGGRKECSLFPHRSGISWFR